MAKITRQNHKTFGGTGSSDNFAKFGSLVAAAPIKTKDIATIQSLPAWDEGFQSSIYGADKDLLLEDLNAVIFEHSRQVSYLFQAGVAEWQADTTYFKGSICQRTTGGGDATGEMYMSAIDTNLGNALPVQANNANWTYLNPPPIPVGTSLDYMGVGVPVGFFWEDGSTKSRTAEAALFAALNVTLAGNLTNGSPIVTGIPSTADLKAGFFVSGTGIPSAAQILTVDSGTQVTLTLPASSTQTPSAVTFGPHGIGDGTTTFTLPDTRRRVMVGAGGSGNATLAAAPGAVGGEETHVLTIGEMPAHGHNVPGTYATTGGDHNAPAGPAADNPYTMTADNTGGGGAHNNIQPSLVCTKIIKY